MIRVVERNRNLLIATYVVAITALISLALVVPGRTFATVYGHDLFVHLDGAWRVAAGQLPNRDFHTPLGLLAYVLPGLALKLSGTLGLTMPLAMLFFALLVAPMIIHVGQSRLPLWLALALATYLIVMVTAPINIGENPTSLSFAMYYNRWSWAASMLLFVTFSPAKIATRRTGVADALTIAALLTIMFHLKTTFFVISVGYVLAMIVVKRTRVAALSGLMLAITALIVIAAVLQTTSSYVQDIQSAAAVSGVVRNGLYALIGMGVMNGVAVLALILVGAVAWLRGVGWPEFFAASYILLTSLVVANQNSQGWELPSLFAAGIVLYQGPSVRAESRMIDRAGGLAAAFGLTMLAYTHLTLGAVALVMHTRQASSSASSAAAVDGVVLANHYPGAPSPQFFADAYRLPAVDPDRLAKLRTEITASEYADTLKDGVALLRNNPVLAGTVETLDLANPFNALLRRRPPRHDNSWNHLGRTFNDAIHLPVSELLGDVDVVMEPKDSTGAEGTATLRRICSSYLRQHFRLAAESAFWRAYVRTDTRP